ncbi:hypothetical protein DV738_g807, partial [Chaetothyriales sp. CBS 135597]
MPRANIVVLMPDVQIHDDPELNFREFHAHDNICDLLEKLGYQVKRHTYGLETSFEVESGHGGKLVVFNAEYDALPGIGHACGHNLIATSSIAAFIATAEALRSTGAEGRVRLLGTPAEEGGGGKIRLIEAGAYTGVDACLMAHPMGFLGPGVDGISAGRTIACRQVAVTFKGVNAHAGISPWKGKNALDALVASYNNISLLRQQIPPTARVHGVVRQGGAEPNIIPDTTSLDYLLRDTTFSQVEDLTKKVQACFDAGALATGCQCHCDWQLDKDYKDLRPNPVLTREFKKHMHALGRDYLADGPFGGASTDMGNVTYELPGFHCAFSIGTTDPEVQPHTPEFAAAAGTPTALERALDCGKGMAVTVYDLLTHSDLMEEAWKTFKADSELPAFILGALTSIGGTIGYARTGSIPSIAAGLTVGTLYGLGGYRIQKKLPYGVELALVASIILAGSSIPRAIRLGKPLPIGLSVLATTGLLVYGRAFLAARG